MGLSLFYVQGNYDMNNFRNVKNNILSNGCDRSGSECHIVGDMSVANF